MTANAETIQAEVARRVPSMVARWYVLAMMCLVYTLSIADRYVTSTVLEPIRAELNSPTSACRWSPPGRSPSST